ncbi:MAG TPA: hypothetical protein VGL22_06885 [Terracidiphilus sp.]
MKSHVRWSRILLCASLYSVLLILSLTALVQIQQRHLRWRAERLLAYIRAVKMGKSTWATHRALCTNGELGGAWEGSCSMEHCDYQIATEDMARALPVVVLPSGSPRVEPHRWSIWFIKHYVMLGGRLSLVWANFQVKNGIIWTKSFSVFAAVNRHDAPQEYFDLLSGNANGASRLRMDGPPYSKAQHPEYTIYAAGTCARCAGFCSGCQRIRANFTPFADPRVLEQIFEFKLSCLTRWRDCDQVAEIMPGLGAAARK